TPSLAFGNTTVELLIVAVPVDAPRFNVVAAPKALTVVAVELNIEAVVVVVVISALVAPLTARSPPTVVRPDPRNVYVGFKTALPNEMFSEPFNVDILM